MRGWAGKKKSKKVNWKSQKKVKSADPSLGGLLEATKSQKKVQKKSKNSQKKSKVEKFKKKSKKVEKKSKKSRKKSKKVKKSQNKGKCEHQARILALADYWRRQKVKKSQKKSKKVNSARDSGPDRGGYLGLWGGYQGHQGQGWAGAEETLGQWLGLGRGPATLGLGLAWGWKR